VNQKLSGKLSTLAGAAVLISVITLVSRIIGFARNIALASWVGTGGVAQPYATANTVPNILFEVAAGGALAGVVIPLLASAIAHNDSERLSRIGSAILTWTVAALVPLSALVAIFAPQIISLAGLGSAELKDTAVFFLRVFSVQIPLYGVGIMFGGVLQAHKKFFWPAVAPLFSSIVVIGTYFAFGKLAHGNQGNIEELTVQALQVLAWGTTAGVAAMALTMVVPALSLDLKLKPSFRFPDGLARRARQLAFAGIGALVAQQLATAVVMLVANRYGLPQTYNVYGLAQAVYLLPYAVLIVPIVTSAFPRIAEMVARGEHDEFAGMVARTTRTVIAISMLGAVVLVAAALPMEKFFGTFTKGSVDSMGWAIGLAAPGLVGFSLILHLSRVLYSRDQGKAAVTYVAAGWIVTAITLAVLPIVVGKPEWTLALFSVAQTAGMCVAGAGLVYAVRKSCGINCVLGVGGTTLRVLLSGVVAGALGLSISMWLTPDVASVWESVGVGVLGAAVAAVSYIGIMFVLDRKAIGALIPGRKSSASVEG